MKQLLTILIVLATFTAAHAQSPRYFLVTYAYSKGIGSIGVSSSVYPSKAAITNILRKKYTDTTMNVVIQNVMEFKTFAEFSAFFNGSSYYDTIITAKAKPVDNNQVRTWYFRDLKILPNTGQCLTDQIQKVADSALAMGGTTNLVISDEGVYNYNMPPKITNGAASVTIDIGCYPDGKGSIAEIERGKCN